MTRLLLAALVLFAAFGARPALASEVARYAIVIGNNRSDQGPSHDLRYADDDAAALHELLLEAGVQSTLLTTLDEESRRLRPNLKTSGPPRAREVERAFAAAVAAMRDRNGRKIPTEFFLFYSGHGNVERGEGYVLLDDQRLSRGMLYSLLSRSPATRNHVFVDACRSFYLAYGKGPGGERSPYDGAAPVEAWPSSLRNTGFVLSTSSDRESHEWERYQAGILSYELRSALRGGADTNLDGTISYAELGAFLKAANESIPNSKFRPEFTLRPPASNYREGILAWSPGSPTIRLGAASLGHVYIETANGQRLLDVHPVKGVALHLHVPPRERPLFVRNHDETAEYVVMDDRPLEITSLEQTPQIASKGALHIALEKLFSMPFGPRDVALYEQSARTQPAFPMLEDRVEASPRTRDVIGTTALITGGVALAAGATLSTISYITYRNGEGKSQREIEDRNHSVRKLNLASIVCYTVAGVSGAAWGVTKLWPVSVNTLQSGRTTNGLTLDVSGRF